MKKERKPDFEENEFMLTEQANLLYECKICRIIFPAKELFFSHKRDFCKEKFGASFIKNEIAKNSKSKAFPDLKEEKVLSESFQRTSDSTNRFGPLIDSSDNDEKTNKLFKKLQNCKQSLSPVLSLEDSKWSIFKEEDEMSQDSYSPSTSSSEDGEIKELKRPQTSKRNYQSLRRSPQFSKRNSRSLRRSIRTSKINSPSSRGSSRSPRSSQEINSRTLRSSRPLEINSRPLETNSRRLETNSRRLETNSRPLKTNSRPLTKSISIKSERGSNSKETPTRILRSSFRSPGKSLKSVIHDKLFSQSICDNTEQLSSEDSIAPVNKIASRNVAIRGRRGGHKFCRLDFKLTRNANASGSKFQSELQDLIIID